MRALPKANFLLLPLTFDRGEAHSVVECRGEYGGYFGFAAGDAGSADTQDACVGVDAWVGDCAAYSAGVEGGAADWTGFAYPALHRLEYKGWIRADWGASENNRRAKFYSLTATGRAQLKAELKDWERLTTAIGLVLGQV
jgi:hypothetical protein